MAWLFNINNPADKVIGYINWDKTNTIISSIFLSVILAFTVGLIIMFISRLLFSFQYKRRLQSIGLVWASLAMVAISYFLIYKGLKSTYSTESLSPQELVEYTKALHPTSKDSLKWDSNLTITNPDGSQLEFTRVEKDGKPVYEVFFGNKRIKEFTDFIKSNIRYFLLSFFIFWVLLFYLLLRLNINPLKIVVFSGTFSLAMAFAGNDLVNFIGVPLAGWQSFELFRTANEAAGNTLLASEYKMIGLKFPIQTPYIYLLVAGLVMTLTLWFSKKARTVTETEVKLGTQEETQEKFNSNLISRAIVQLSILLTKKWQKAIPYQLQNTINRQFTGIATNEKEEAAFDLVRASVNLTMASMLIALGTSLKLPLSTTYVTFMVAMGTSLADRAWGRETAAYRIAGVLNVILGWFITAAIALSVSAIMAIILINFKLWGLLGLVIILLLVVLRTNYYHKTIERKKSKAENLIQEIDFSVEKAYSKTSKEIALSLTTIIKAYEQTIEGLLSEDKVKLKKAKELNEELIDYYKDIKNNLYKAIKKSKLPNKQTAQLYILSNDLMQDILQSLSFIIHASEDHVRNAHHPLLASQITSTNRIKTDVISYLSVIAQQLEQHDFSELKESKALKRSIFDHIESSLSYQVEGITKKEFGFKNTDLMLRILLETKDLVAIAVRFAKLLNRLYNGQSPLGNKDN